MSLTVSQGTAVITWPSCVIDPRKRQLSRLCLSVCGSVRAKAVTRKKKGDFVASCAPARAFHFHGLQEAESTACRGNRGTKKERLGLIHHVERRMNVMRAAGGPLSACACLCATRPVQHVSSPLPSPLCLQHERNYSHSLLSTSSWSFLASTQHIGSRTHTRTYVQLSLWHLLRRAGLFVITAAVSFSLFLLPLSISY